MAEPAWDQPAHAAEAEPEPAWDRPAYVSDPEPEPEPQRSFDDTSSLES